MIGGLFEDAVYNTAGDLFEEGRPVEHDLVVDEIGDNVTENVGRYFETARRFLLSITVPALGIYHQEIMPIRWRTVMSGAATMAIGLSWSITTLVGGYVITNLGYQRFFFAAAALTATGGILFWAYFRVPRGELAAEPATEPVGQVG